MSTTARELHIHLHGYWHAGAGRSSGHHLDALCERDDGLPILPGRQLKGVLRDAVRRAEAWGWLQDIDLPSGPASDHQSLLFGSSNQAEGRFSTSPGMLLVGSAHLPEAERLWLSQPGQAAVRSALFDELFSTAINEHGSALAQSLRGLEVAIPAPLAASLELGVTAQQPGHRQQQQAYLDSGRAWQVLEAALPLLDHIGAHRSRGLGECTVRLTSAGA